MTFIISQIAESSNQSQSTLLSPSSVAANQRMPCSSITHTGLTVNGNGQLVLSTGYTFVLMGSHYIERVGGYGAIESRWYDVTNSAFVGRSVKNWLNTTNTGGKRTAVARCVIVPSVQTTLEMRIVSVTSGTVVNNNSLFDYVGTPWYSVISF